MKKVILLFTVFALTLASCDTYEDANEISMIQETIDEVAAQQYDDTLLNSVLDKKGSVSTSKSTPLTLGAFIHVGSTQKSWLFKGERFQHDLNTPGDPNYVVTYGFDTQIVDNDGTLSYDGAIVTYDFITNDILKVKLGNWEGDTNNLFVKRTYAPNEEKGKISGYPDRIVHYQGQSYSLFDGEATVFDTDGHEYGTEPYFHIVFPYAGYAYIDYSKDPDAPEPPQPTAHTIKYVDDDHYLTVTGDQLGTFNMVNSTVIGYLEYENEVRNYIVQGRTDDTAFMVRINKLNNLILDVKLWEVDYKADNKLALVNIINRLTPDYHNAHYGEHENYFVFVGNANYECGENYREACTYPEDASYFTTIRFDFAALGDIPL